MTKVNHFLARAITLEFPEVAEYLISRGADPNATKYDEIPLFNAIHNEDEKMVRLILRAGGDVNRRDKRGQTAMHLAASKNNNALVSLLLDAGADVDVSATFAFGEPLHVAVALAGREVIDLLLQHGADVNAKSPFGDTPLHHAQTEAVARLLVDGGAIVGAKARIVHEDNSITEMTPEEFASFEGRKEVADFLRTIRSA